MGKFEPPGKNYPALKPHEAPSIFLSFSRRVLRSIPRISAARVLLPSASAKTLLMSEVDGNKTRAAEILGIDRKTLREKLKKNEGAS